MLLTGFAIAALMDCQLMVSMVIMTANPPVIANTHQEISVL